MNSNEKEKNQKKIKVWLDDERDPTKPEIMSGFGSKGDETWVKTASEAIRLLKTGNVEYISLDHDLGEHSDTGEKVAKWIEEQAFFFDKEETSLPPLKWSVHSANPVGRKNITSALNNADKFWGKNELV